MMRRLSLVAALLPFALGACTGTVRKPQPAPAPPVVAAAVTVEPAPVAAPPVAAVAVQPVIAAAPAPSASAAGAFPSPPPLAPPPPPKPAVKREPKAAPTATPSSIAKTETATSKPTASEAMTSTYNLAGHVELIVGAGQSVEADEVTDAVVYFVPSDGAPHPKPGHFLISTHGKKFDPPTIAVPVGSTVSFPNHDEILHNVFSVTPGSAFDLGVYGENGSADYTFKKAGLSVINCNVHQAMQANVLVLDTPYFTRPDKSGNFILPGVPSGPGKLVLWHVRATSQTRAMLAASTEPVALQLTLTKPRVTQHLNKESKPYQPARS